MKIADEQRQHEETPDEALLQALWLDAQFKDSSGERPEVLGVSFGGTNVVAMFKPTIRQMGALDLTLSFSEQTTFIHEVGHALWLVNNGVPMVDDHQDTAHGRHCTNERCGMYYANQGAVDLIEFVIQVVVDGNTVIFGDECLDDLKTHQAELQ